MVMKEKVFMVDSSPVKVIEDTEELGVKFYGSYGAVSLSIYQDWKTKKFSAKGIKEFQKLSEVFYDLAEKAHDANAKLEASD
jgi:hypothetical protein